jgi:hypothetical protein
MFNAVVVAEKKRRKLTHERLSGKYQGVHRRALELLSHPKLRVFAPMLAQFADDVPVPAEIERFFQEAEQNVVRTYTTDACHEW